MDFIHILKFSEGKIVKNLCSIIQSEVTKVLCMGRY